MIDHDLLFKELLTTFFVEFVDLFLPELSAYLDPGSVVFLDKEVFTGGVPRRGKRQVDVVARVQFRTPSGSDVPTDGFFLIHVENQAKRQADFEKRMFRYWARLFEKYHLPVYPIAVFTYDTPQSLEPDRFTVTFPDLDVLDFRYRVIQLNQLSWRDYVERKNPVASALMAKMAIAQGDRWRVKLECLRLLATLKLDRDRMRLISGFIDTYLELSDQERTLFQEALDADSDEDQEVVMEIVTSWMKQGIQQGLQQGREQGMGTLVVRQLRSKFPSLAEMAVEHIHALAEPQLEELGQALLDFKELADLDAWFSRHSA